MTVVLVTPLAYLIESPGTVKDQEANDVGNRLVDHIDDDKAGQTIADDFDGWIFIHWELAVK